MGFPNPFDSGGSGNSSATDQRVGAADQAKVLYGGKGTKYQEAGAVDQSGANLSRIVNAGKGATVNVYESQPDASGAGSGLGSILSALTALTQSGSNNNAFPVGQSAATTTTDQSTTSTSNTTDAAFPSPASSGKSGVSTWVILGVGAAILVGLIFFFKR